MISILNYTKTHHLKGKSFYDLNNIPQQTFLNELNNKFAI